MSIDLENASIRLYEDISLTEELDDPQAQTLLKWGAQQLAQIAGQHTDEEAFEQSFKTLRQFIKRINRMVGRRADLEDEELKSYLEKFVAGAQELNYNTITPENAPQIFDLLRSDLSQSEVLQSILNLIIPTESTH